MGCDIHLFRETKIGNEWIAADDFLDNSGDLFKSSRKEYDERDYYFFGFLCQGVRSNIDFAFLIKYLPNNISSIVARIVCQWVPDGHGHSYITLDELKEKHDYIIKNLDISDSDDKKIILEIIMPKLEELIIDLEDIKINDARIVFFFDN